MRIKYSIKEREEFAMQISELLHPEAIKLNLTSTNKEDVLKEMAGLLVNTGCLLNEDVFLKTIWDREEKGSTGIGFGVAIPHGKSNAVKEARIAFGFSKEGIEYQSLDEKAAHIFFMIAVPEASENEHLKVLAKLSRMLIHQDFRDKLASVESEEELLKVIEDKEQ